MPVCAPDRLAKDPCAFARAQGLSGWRWCLALGAYLMVPMECASVQAHGLSWARVATCMRCSWTAFRGHMLVPWEHVGCHMVVLGCQMGMVGSFLAWLWEPYGTFWCKNWGHFVGRDTEP